MRWTPPGSSEASCPARAGEAPDSILLGHRPAVDGQQSLKPFGAEKDQAISRQKSSRVCAFQAPKPLRTDLKGRKALLTHAIPDVHSPVTRTMKRKRKKLPDTSQAPAPKCSTQTLLRQPQDEDRTDPCSLVDLVLRRRQRACWGSRSRTTRKAHSQRGLCRQALTVTQARTLPAGKQWESKVAPSGDETQALV